MEVAVGGHKIWFQNKKISSQETYPQRRKLKDFFEECVVQILFLTVQVSLNTIAW